MTRTVAVSTTAVVCFAKIERSSSTGPFVFFDQLADEVDHVGSPLGYNHRQAALRTLLGGSVLLSVRWAWPLSPVAAWIIALSFADRSRVAHEGNHCNETTPPTLCLAP